MSHSLRAFVCAPGNRALAVLRVPAYSCDALGRDEGRTASLCRIPTSVWANVRELSVPSESTYFDGSANGQLAALLPHLGPRVRKLHFTEADVHSATCGGGCRTDASTDGRPNAGCRDDYRYECRQHYKDARRLGDSAVVVHTSMPPAVWPDLEDLSVETSVDMTEDVDGWSWSAAALVDDDVDGAAFAKSATTQERMERAVRLNGVRVRANQFGVVAPLPPRLPALRPRARRRCPGRRKPQSTRNSGCDPRLQRLPLSCEPRSGRRLPLGSLARMWLFGNAAWNGRTVVDPSLPDEVCRMAPNTTGGNRAHTGTTKERRKSSSATHLCATNKQARASR